MHKRQTAILLALAGIILFSTKAIFVKLAYQFNADPITMLLLRMVFSLPFYVFLPSIAILKNLLRPTKTTGY